LLESHISPPLFVNFRIQLERLRMKLESMVAIQINKMELWVRSKMTLMLIIEDIVNNGREQMG